MSRFKLVFKIIWLCVCKGLIISNQNLSDNVVICDKNDDCIINCDGNLGFECIGLKLKCQNSLNGNCMINCNGNNACKDMNIDAINVRSIDINCNDNGLLYFIYVLGV